MHHVQTILAALPVRGRHVRIVSTLLQLNPPRDYRTQSRIQHTKLSAVFVTKIPHSITPPNMAAGHPRYLLHTAALYPHTYRKWPPAIEALCAQIIRAGCSWQSRTDTAGPGRRGPGPLGPECGHSRMHRTCIAHACAACVCMCTCVCARECLSARVCIVQEYCEGGASWRSSAQGLRRRARKPIMI